MSSFDANAVPFRLTNLERFQAQTEDWRRMVDDDRQDLKYLRQDMKALSDSVDGLRKVILAFALSVAGSAIVFAFTVLVATGKIGGN